MALEKPTEEIEIIIKEMQEDYKTRGIEITKMEDNYQLVSKKEYYEYIISNNRQKGWSRIYQMQH